MGVGGRSAQTRWPTPLGNLLSTRIMKTLNVAVNPRGIAHVEMARPVVFNAFDEIMIEELDSTFEALGKNNLVRAIVLSGLGKAFSAGADLQWMERASKATQECNLSDARGFASMLHRIASCPQPTVARVHGLALGGGVGLVCACDMAVASEDAKFAVSEARFGILPSVIGPYLTNAVGKRQAKRLALTASRIDAKEAKQIGLVQQVVPAAELDTAVSELVGHVLQNGPAALSEIKALFAQLEVGDISPEVRELTAQTISRVRMTPEAREGFSAFFSKRPPAWMTTQ
jgi:methylglutaconyl-CoA hydratase